MEALERFYQFVAPWLDVDANDATLLAWAGDPPTLESLTEAAKQLPDLVIRQDYARFPANATTAGRNMQMDVALPRALAAEREQLIAEIGNGQSTFSLVTAWGSRKVYDSATGVEIQY